MDGLAVNFDVQPVSQHSRTLVPFRTIAEALNIDVSWDEPTQTITAVYQEKKILLQINNPTAFINNNAVKLDAPPFILSGKTFSGLTIQK